MFTLTNVASLCSKIAFRNYSPSTAELKQNGGSDSAALAASQIRSQVREIEKKVVVWLDLVWENREGGETNVG